MRLNDAAAPTTHSLEETATPVCRVQEGARRGIGAVREHHDLDRRRGALAQEFERGFKPFASPRVYTPMHTRRGAGSVARPGDAALSASTRRASARFHAVPLGRFGDVLREWIAAMTRDGSARSTTLPDATLDEKQASSPTRIARNFCRSQSERR